MKTALLTGLDEEQKRDVKQLFVASILLRKQIVKELEGMQRESYTTALSKITYDNPNWSLLQADHRGYERAIKEVIALLK